MRKTIALFLVLIVIFNLVLITHSDTLDASNLERLSGYSYDASQNIWHYREKYIDGSLQIELHTVGSGSTIDSTGLIITDSRYNGKNGALYGVMFVIDNRAYYFDSALALEGGGIFIVIGKESQALIKAIAEGIPHFVRIYINEVVGYDPKNPVTYMYPITHKTYEDKEINLSKLNSSLKRFCQNYLKYNMWFFSDKGIDDSGLVSPLMVFEISSEQETSAEESEVTINGSPSLLFSLNWKSSPEEIDKEMQSNGINRGSAYARWNSDPFLVGPNGYRYYPYGEHHVFGGNGILIGFWCTTEGALKEIAIEYSASGVSFETVLNELCSKYGNDYAIGKETFPSSRSQEAYVWTTNDTCVVLTTEDFDTGGTGSMSRAKNGKCKFAISIVESIDMVDNLVL